MLRSMVRNEEDPEDEVDYGYNGAATVKCANCKQFLSIFPVYMNRDETFVCGRCPLVEAKQPVRQVAYEVVAALMKFQCSFKECGCNEELFPDELVQHEGCCPYRKFVCKPNCNWNGSASDVAKHFTADHPHLLFNNIVKLNTKEALPEMFLVKYAQDLFQFRTIRIGNDLNLSVTFVSVPKQGFQCNVEYLNTEFPTATITIQSDMRKSDSDLCFLSINTQANEFTVRVKKIEQLGASETAGTSELENSILKLLECHVCFETMVPPIQLCTTGHSACSNCVQKMINCGLCRQPFTATRNFDLEKVTKTVGYYCRFEKCGEKLVGSDNKEHHERICMYAPLSCIFCTHSAELEDFLSHIKENHSREILAGNYFPLAVNTTVENGVVARYYVIRSSSVFVFQYAKHNSLHKFSMNLIGPLMYAHTLDFILTFTSSKTDETNRTKFRLPCDSDDASCLALQHSIIESLMDGPMLPMYIDIIEKHKQMFSLM